MLRFLGENQHASLRTQKKEPAPKRESHPRAMKLEKKKNSESGMGEGGSSLETRFRREEEIFKSGSKIDRCSSLCVF